jgi:hypothetical protein
MDVLVCALGDRDNESLDACTCTLTTGSGGILIPERGVNLSTSYNELVTSADSDPSTCSS